MAKEKIQISCQYQVSDLVICGATTLQDHTCLGYPKPVRKGSSAVRCTNPPYNVKCLAFPHLDSIHHTCAQFMPTDFLLPANYHINACKTCLIPHNADISCTVALDFSAPTYQEWKLTHHHENIIVTDFQRLSRRIPYIMGRKGVYQSSSSSKVTMSNDELFLPPQRLLPPLPDHHGYKRG